MTCHNCGNEASNEWLCHPCCRAFIDKRIEEAEARGYARGVQEAMGLVCARLSADEVDQVLRALLPGGKEGE